MVVLALLRRVLMGYPFRVVQIAAAWRWGYLAFKNIRLICPGLTLSPLYATAMTSLPLLSLVRSYPLLCHLYRASAASELADAPDASEPPLVGWLFAVLCIYTILALTLNLGLRDIHTWESILTRYATAVAYHSLAIVFLVLDVVFVKEIARRQARSAQRSAGAQSQSTNGVLNV